MVLRRVFLLFLARFRYVLALFSGKMHKVPQFLHKKNPKCLVDIYIVFTNCQFRKQFNNFIKRNFSQNNYFTNYVLTNGVLRGIIVKHNKENAGVSELADEQD